MKNTLSKLKNTYNIILILVIAISIMQIEILVTELYAVADGALQASAQEQTAKAAANQPVIKNNEASEVVPHEISIEKIGLNLPVVSQPLVNGTWNTAEGVANYAEGTSGINGKTGNIGIFAHDRDNGFTNIKLLTAGDTIVVKGSGVKATYTVEKSAIANPSQVDVFYATNEPKLTLITCDGTFSEQRYVVVAQLSNLEIL